MLNTLGCVVLDTAEAQRVSHRMGAFASRQLAGLPLVHWAVRRASEAERLDKVVVILPDGDHVDEVCETVPPDVAVFASAKPDALSMTRECLEAFPAEAIVRIRIESPLVDPALIDRLVNAVAGEKSVEYATFSSQQGSPALRRQLGLLADFCRATALRRADRLARSADDRRDFTRFMHGHPEHFCLRLLPIPPELDRDDLRLSVRIAEDWEHAEEIVDALGADGLEWQRIARLLEEHPAIRRRMALLNRREAVPA